MAARKKSPKADAAPEATAPEAVVGNIGEASTSQRDPEVEQLSETTQRVTY